MGRKRMSNAELKELVLQQKARPIFFGLKILEISLGIAFICLPWLLGKIAQLVELITPNKTFIGLWLIGLVLTAATIIVVGGIIYIIKGIVKVNRKWARKIVEDIRK